MKKTMGKYIVVFLATSLFLPGFVRPAMACHCPPCNRWTESGGCEYDCRYPKEGESCCDSSNCKSCQWQSGDRYRCEPYCPSNGCEGGCNGHGHCPVCNDDPTKCCDNGVCVDKCDPDGAPCTHDNPPQIQSGCPWVSETDHRCPQGEAGKSCAWTLDYEYSNSAKCADCAPGCNKVIDSEHPYCAFYKAETCREEWFVGCGCGYEGREQDRPTYGDGSHYICN
jgi:hypothetical protein